MPHAKLRVVVCSASQLKHSMYTEANRKSVLLVTDIADHDRNTNFLQKHSQRGPPPTSDRSNLVVHPQHVMEYISSSTSMTRRCADSLL